MKNKLHRREFLNTKTGSAHYELDADTRYGGNLTISDCNRLVTLDFEVHSFNKAARRKELKERIKKAQKLEKALGDLVDFLEKNAEEITTRSDDY